MGIGPSNGSLADVAHIQILSEVESNAHIVNTTAVIVELYLMM